VIFHQHDDGKGKVTVTVEGPWEQETEFSLELLKNPRPGLLVRRNADTVTVSVSNGRATYRVIEESPRFQAWRGSVRAVLVEGTIE
jgi:hypothetical protein